MKRRRQAEALEKINLLDLVPIRRAHWQEVGDCVVIERPKPSGSGLRGLLEWLRYRLAVRRIRLDERGSRAWLLLDGLHTVGEVASALRLEFGELVEPAEERIGHLVRMLHKEELLAYPGWDDLTGVP